MINVPEGTYVIEVFQDVNENGKLDMGLFGPKEPWACTIFRKSPDTAIPNSIR